MEEVDALVLDRGYPGGFSPSGTFLYGGCKSGAVCDAARLPVALQVNANTLLRWSTRRLGLELLGSSCPLLASDCHNLTSRPPNLAEARKVLQQKMGEDFLAQIDKNAADVLCAAAEKVVP